MRYLILSVALAMMGTSNAAAETDTCEALPVAWEYTPAIVRVSVINGLNSMYAESAAMHDADTYLLHECMLSKVDFFVDSVILHCKMGVDSSEAEQTAFNGMLNLCIKELLGHEG